MKTLDFERILKSMGFELTRVSKHRIWSNGTKNIAVPHDKKINRMIARRTLKEIGYKEPVPEVNYRGLHENI